MLRRWIHWFVPTASLLVLSAVACSSDGAGAETCRTIESARCERAQACGISLATPVHEGNNDVAACIRYYKDACMHGLARGSEPNGADVTACVLAIRSDCAAVKVPENHPACKFLYPTVDASIQPTTDAAPDAANDSAISADAGIQ